MPLSDHLELMQRLCAKAGQGHECPSKNTFVQASCHSRNSARIMMP